MKKWTVYYINTEGYREGVEHIHAETKSEAIETYRRFFNVTHPFAVNAIPCFDRIKSQVIIDLSQLIHTKEKK